MALDCFTSNFLTAPRSVLPPTSTATASAPRTSPTSRIADVVQRCAPFGSGWCGMAPQEGGEVAVWANGGVRGSPKIAQDPAWEFGKSRAKSVVCWTGLEFLAQPSCKLSRGARWCGARGGTRQGDRRSCLEPEQMRRATPCGNDTRAEVGGHGDFLPTGGLCPGPGTPRSAPWGLHPCSTSRLHNARRLGLPANPIKASIARYRGVSLTLGWPALHHSS
jgi:hypothetical protein